MSDIDERMKAAGMMSITEMLAKNSMDEWHANTGVRNLDDFENWIQMKRGEMLRLQASIELDGEDNDLYEWTIAHVAVLGEVMANFRQAMEKE